MSPQTVTAYLNGDMTTQRFITSTTYNQELAADMFSASVTYDPFKSPPKNK